MPEICTAAALGLTHEYVQPELECHFIACDWIWLVETRRRIFHRSDACLNKNRLRWLVHRGPNCLLDEDWSSVPGYSFVAIQISHSIGGGSLTKLLARINKLNSRNVAVAVVGGPFTANQRLAYRMAGAAAIVTHPGRSDKLSALIGAAAKCQPWVIADWQSRFMKRLPWPPVPVDVD